jgi:Flp pilus assembly protein TadD
VEAASTTLHAALRRANEAGLLEQRGLRMLASTLRDDGHTMLGMIVLTYLVEIAPDSSGAHQWLGEAMAEDGRLGEARRLLSRALELDPSNTQAAMKLSRLDPRAPGREDRP